jgi:hypothetical protein
VTKPWTLHAVDKDLRALLPTWCVFALTIAIAASGLGTSIALLVYLMGCSMLGAMVIGHEFSHRTISALLTLPIGRRQMLLTKLAVLALMVAGLGVVAAAWHVGDVTSVNRGMERYLPQAPAGASALVLPALCGLCVAPWLTMLGRSPLAGAVFTCATFCLMWFAGQVIGVLMYGMRPEVATPMMTLRTAIAWNGTLAACAIAAAGMWFTFARLQATEFRSVSLDVRRRFVPRARPLVATQVQPLPSRRGHWLWKLTAKEIRLQSLTLVIGGLYVLAWYAVVNSRSLLPESLQLPLGMVTPIFGGTVGLVVGSFASAEERHLGTAAWQGLLPVAAWRQWTVKVVSALTIALVIGAGLPRILELVTPGLLPFYDFMPATQPLIVLIVTISSLYVSSLSTSGLRAVVTSIAVLAGSVWLFSRSFELLIKTAAAAILPLLRSAGWFRYRHDIHTDVVMPPGLFVAPVLALCGLAFVLGLAMSNHRSAERRGRRLWTQMASLCCGYLTACLVLGGVHASKARHWRYLERGGVQLTGHFVFDGSSPVPPPAELAQVWVYLVPVDDSRDADGIQAEITNDKVVSPRFYPDRYRVLVPGGGRFYKTWTFKGATYQGRDITYTPVDIRADLHDVTFTFTDHPGTLTGRVQNPDGSSGWGAVVLMFSVDRSTWSERFVRANRQMKATGLSPDRGEFSWTMPPDGDYFLIAVSRDVVRGVMRSICLDGGCDLYLEKDPSALFARLAPLAERVQAREGQTLTRNLIVREVK